MASIYRFTRKSKKANAKNRSEDAEFNTLLFADEEPAHENAAPAQIKEEAPNEVEKASPFAEEAPEEKILAAAADEEDEAIEEAEAEKTSEISLTKEEPLEEVPASPEDTVRFDASAVTEKKDPVTLEDTVRFDVSALAEETSTLSDNEKEALVRALEETQQVDAKKFDEVFGHAKKKADGTSPLKYDETTELLKEIFGATPASHSKDEKSLQMQEEIHGVFHEGKTLQEALADAREKDSVKEESSEYVAIHDAPTESTKEYHATFSFEEELESITPESAEASVPELAEEVRVSDGDDIYSDTYDEIEETKRHLSILPEEYTSEDEFDEFAEHLRNRNFTSLRNVIWTFFAFLAVLYLESATFSDLWHPAFLQPSGMYGMIFLLVDIQLLLISVLLALPAMADGFLSVFKGKVSRNTPALFAVLVAIVHAVFLMVTGATEYPLFGSVAALFVMMTAIADFLEAKRIHRTFRICGRHGEKLVAERLGDDSAEAEAFREQLSGTPKFYSVCKANFVESFFRRVQSRSKADHSHGVTVLLSLLFAAGFAGYSYWKSAELLTAVNRFAMMAMMALPMSGIFTVVLPFSHLSKKAAKKSAAIISAKTADEYAAADVVSFTDKEIFPPRSVKINTIRTYGQTRIDKAILYGAMIFQKLGGPLSYVFKKTISGVCEEIPEDFDFLEITADGMCAKIDGLDVFVGNKNYLLSYDFGYTKDDIDDGFEARAGKIMYMVINSELAAKFYIRYSISKRFKKTVFTLFKSGICPAVKTCDPNIDSDLFRSLLQNDKIPAGIVKTCEAMKDAPGAETSESGVVCTSTIANLLHVFSLCDSLKHLSRANVVIKLLSLLLGVGIVVFFFFIEDLARITGLFVLLYQILWMIPVIIPSLSE